MVIEHHMVSGELRWQFVSGRPSPAARYKQLLEIFSALQSLYSITALWISSDPGDLYTTPHEYRIMM